MAWDRARSDTDERLLLVDIELVVARLGLASLAAAAAGGRLVLETVGEHRLLVRYWAPDGRIHTYDSETR